MSRAKVKSARSLLDIFDGVCYDMFKIRKEKGYMLYKRFLDREVSALGFGMMRLPMKDGEVDREQTEAMIDYAVTHGVNYFDTAYPYHGGVSELLAGEFLSKYPRESYCLATKFPGHQLSSSYDAREIFEEQLSKCRTEYFDYYLLHNVNENSIDVYRDKKWNIINEFVKLRKEGKIRHLGFSSHGGYDLLKSFLDEYGKCMEFCQIQFNYLDYTLQDAKKRYELLTERNIPVIVMEPVRGGRLANLDEESSAMLKKARPDDSIVSWALRWAASFDNVKVVLSGMSDMSQMSDNIKTIESFEKISDGEQDMLDKVSQRLHNNIPCTGCRYCCDGCPMGLNIPYLLDIANEMRFSPSVNATMRLDPLPDDKKPSACLSCGACKTICPQNIDIPLMLRELSEAAKKVRPWAEICKEREEAAKRMRQNGNK